MRFPAPFMDLLKKQNGAILFAGSLSVYGVLSTNKSLNREQPFMLPPFDIEDENKRWPPYDPERLLCIGGYGFDGSGACIDREDGRIHVFRRATRTLAKSPVATWPSLDTWIRTEVSRLSSLFDSKGNRLADESLTIPYSLN